MATQERSQHPQNSYGIRRPDRKRVRAWVASVSNINSTLKGQSRCLRCGQPLSVDLDHQISGARGTGTTEYSKGRSAASIGLYIIMFLCQHLGVALEEGAYSWDKMSDPAYKPPLRFWLALRLQNGGRICGTLRYFTILPRDCHKTSQIIWTTSFSADICRPHGGQK